MKDADKVQPTGQAFYIVLQAIIFEKRYTGESRTEYEERLEEMYRRKVGVPSVLVRCVDWSGNFGRRRKYR